MRRVIFILALTSVLIIAGASAAFANFGPHGGYADDTDACAGCHRAHTSFSSLTWQTSTGPSSALLVSTASTMEEFCLVCHGDDAPGASTNVASGIFDAGPSRAATGTIPAGTYMYQTNSRFGASLNGGAFGGTSAPSVTSVHDMDLGAATDPMWGAGSSAPAGSGITCTSCHDVHGSSNYRLLKDTVNSVAVGGYDANDVPQPFVYSSEVGYPRPNVATSTPNGGWAKHEAGMTQMSSYRPNYTTEEYYWTSGATYATGIGAQSMSTWCSACHTQYNKPTSAYDYGSYEASATYSRDATGQLIASNVGPVVGSRTRHRHAVDTTPGTANTISGYGTNAVVNSALPLERTNATLANRATGTQVLEDYMGCLTCHFAHGTSAVMTGWANANLVNTSATASWTVAPKVGAPAGVAPNFSSSLLRLDNRGVCEGCHNK